MIDVPLDREQLVTAALELIEAWVEHVRAPNHSRIHNTVVRWVMARDKLVKIVYPGHPKQPERYTPPLGTASVEPEQLIELARVFAGQIRDSFVTTFYQWLMSVDPLTPNGRVDHRRARERRFQEGVKDRVSLAMDCYLTGAAAMLKLGIIYMTTEVLKTKESE